MKWYGIRNKQTKKPLGFDYDSDEEGGISCGFANFSIDDTIWLVCKREYAEEVLIHDTNEYCAGYNSPGWCGIDMTHYEIFEVNIGE